MVSLTSIDVSISKISLELPKYFLYCFSFFVKSQYNIDHQENMLHTLCTSSLLSCNIYIEKKSKNLL